MMHVLEAILLVILFLLAAFTAASEIAMVAASRFKLKRLANEGAGAAKLVLKILEMPEKFLGTILVANNVIETLIAAIITAIVISFIGEGSRSVLFATVIAAFLIIIFEVAAKTLAARRSEKIALTLVGPVRLLIWLLSPIVRVLAIITNFVVNVIAGETKGKPALVTEEEIRSLIKIGTEEGVIHKEKYKMLTNVFDFSNVVVKDVMTAKKDIVAIDIVSKFEDILALVLESGYSRIPVYKDRPDNIVGIINMKDLLNLTCNRELVVLQDIVYPAV
ncbi:MAG: DUF21 domain-containing protein, partial [Candidatus Omnitrophica bacterium]|nr:DUF21 domain-containing protein [Candidatus Omnitrophota bacterium]